MFDAGWRFDYIGTTGQSYGWDVVLDGQHAWFMDNGKHRYVRTMRGAGVSRTANRLVRVSMADARDHQCLDVSGLAGGSITNPPLVDLRRRNGEEVVLLAIETGTELARVRSGGFTQGVVFPSPGWGRDFYWSSMGRLARIFVQ